MKNFLVSIFEILRIVVLALIIVIPVRFFIFQPFLVQGQSMEPNFENGDYLVVDELTYRFGEPKRGEIIVFKVPQMERERVINIFGFKFSLKESPRFIKRVIGLPGETVEISDGKIKISNDEENFSLDESKYLSNNYTLGQFQISLGKEEYFVLGDNRSHSLDSRSIGPISKKFVIGRVILRLWPIKEISKIESPRYPEIETSH